MQPYILLTVQTLCVVGGVLAFSWWLRRRLPVRWSTWGWGALAFVLSQAVRLPLLLGLTLVLNPIFKGTDPGAVFWLNLVVLAGTSGLFEETARYVVLRWWTRGARRWHDALMFGAGHGGIEAILIFGFSAASAFVLLATGDQILAALRQSNPTQATAVAAQLESLRTLQPWGILAGLWERVLAITLHIALSIMVLRAVRERRLRWWALAVLWHDLVNAIALIAARYGGTLAAELTLTALSIGSLLVILRSRDKAEPEPGDADLQLAPH